MCIRDRFIAGILVTDALSVGEYHGQIAVQHREFVFMSGVEDLHRQYSLMISKSGAFTSDCTYSPAKTTPVRVYVAHKRPALRTHPNIVLPMFKSA